MSEQEEFRTYLVALSEMVPGFTLKAELIALYDEAAAKMGYKRSAIAIKQIIASRNSRDAFPSVSDIIEIVSFNFLDPEEISTKITGAVSKFGNYRAADARIYLGEVAWDIVKIEGGWENVCQMLTYDNLSTLQAQWRRLAQVIIQRKKNAEMVRIGYLEPMPSIAAAALAQITPPNEPAD